MLHAAPTHNLGLQHLTKLTEVATSDQLMRLIICENNCDLMMQCAS